MVFESRNTGEHDVRAIRNDFTPGFLLRIPGRSGNEPEGTAARIRSNEKNLRAYTGNGTRMMIRVVFVTVLPLRHQPELAKGLIRAQKPDLAGRVACRGEQQKPAAPRTFDFDMKTLVSFLIKQSVRTSHP